MRCQAARPSGRNSARAMIHRKSRLWIIYMELYQHTTSPFINREKTLLNISRENLQSNAKILSFGNILYDLSTIVCKICRNLPKFL